MLLLKNKLKTKQIKKQIQVHTKYTLSMHKNSKKCTKNAH